MNKIEWDNLKKGNRIRSIKRISASRRVLKVFHDKAGLVSGVYLTRLQNFPFSQIPVYMPRKNAYLFRKV